MWVKHGKIIGKTQGSYIWLVIWNIHGNNMVYSTLAYDYINIYLVGGDWNHGILHDVPFSWESHHPI